MLSPAFATAGSHLSSSAQATLNKHLPSLSSKRFIQSSILNSGTENAATASPKTPTVQTVEVSCLTGKIMPRSIKTN